VEATSEDVKAIDAHRGSVADLCYWESSSFSYLTDNQSVC